MIISQALIMAAGHATRMRPLTDDLPKPLLEVNGTPLLTHIINHLIAENVTRIVINGYHAITPLKAYIADIQPTYPQCDFILSEEIELLETGGGAVQAMQYLDDTAPFYMINGDAYWINPPQSRTLLDLTKAWDQDSHNLLLLLQSCQSMAMTAPVGDYNIHNHHAVRAHNKNGDYMFTGVRICTPNFIMPYALEKFSFLKIMDDCENTNRLGAIVHDGDWYHISTPEDLSDVNAMKRHAS